MKPNRNYITDHIAFERGYIYKVQNGIDSMDDAMYVNEWPECPECGGTLDSKVGDAFGDGGKTTDVCGGCETTWGVITIPTVKMIIDV